MEHEPRRHIVPFSDRHHPYALDVVALTEPPNWWMRETFNGFSQKCFSVRRQKLIRRKYISVSSVCDHLLPPLNINRRQREREISIRIISMQWRGEYRVNWKYRDIVWSVVPPTHCLHNGMMEKGQGKTSNANGKLSVQFRFYEISKR